MQRSSTSSAAAAFASACEEELNGVARDLRAKQSAAEARRKPASGYGLDEQTKLQLAQQASQASLPGAVVEPFGNDFRRKPSLGQSEQLRDLQRIQKIRLANQQESGREQHLAETINTDEEQHLDAFQERMNEFRNHETNITNMEDAENLRKRKRLKWFLGPMVVAFSVVVGVGVAVKFGLDGSSGNGVGAIDDAFKACFMRNESESHPSNRFIELRGVLSSSTGGWDPRPIDNAGSSQRAALCWLTDFDTYKVENVVGSEYEVVQRFALATIYFHFVGTSPEPGSVELSDSNWLDAVHVCKWDFVACGSRDNEVTELALVSLYLNKPIPEEMALMSDLVYLKMPKSVVTGQIPSTLSLLSQLQELDLSYNALTGTIPPELGYLMHLRELRLDENELESEIPDNLFEIPQLHGLFLNNNYLTGTLSSALVNATSLTHISADQNFLKGTIPDISRLTNLEYLALGSNQEIQDSFPDISRLTNLVSLDLVDLDLTGTMPSSVWLFPHLANIDLVGVAGVSGTIPDAIGQLTDLEFLRLGWTKFSGSIPTTVGNLSDLQLLHLDGLIGLTGTIPTELGRLSSLVRLIVPSASSLSENIPDEVCALGRCFLSGGNRPCCVV